MNFKAVSNATEGYCSSILKEAKTNEQLGFPEHDIFLEQGEKIKATNTSIARSQSNIYEHCELVEMFM